MGAGLVPLQLANEFGAVYVQVSEDVFDVRDVADAGRVRRPDLVQG
jgi:hypothetical protein